ncbi:MAG: NAD(P)H-hydrate dehydratase [Sulfuricella sp.]|nr:NAD(P)H-hydrate dehydratase [Sulfuricella sp.]
MLDFAPLYSSAAIREIEGRAQRDIARGRPGLMERAGLAAAELARELAGNGKRILVVAGPGNNGGDALVAARHLKSWWFDVDLVLLGDPAKFPPDAAAAWEAWTETGGTALGAIPEHRSWCLVIDGLFGIGLGRNLGGVYLEGVRHINRLKLPTLALDVPSGLDADTGQLFGAAVRASHTLTFIALKPGLLTANGPDYCGDIQVANLELDAQELALSQGKLLDERIANAFPQRPRNSHKGLLGSVAILGGAGSMVGATILAGRAALKCGAGLVYVATLDEALPFDPVQPELMFCTPAQLRDKEKLTCLVIGPGLGQSASALEHLGWALQADIPLVLDADALNLVAANGNLQIQAQQRIAATLLTPHPAEAGRLLGTDSHDIQQDRVAAALQLAERYHSLVVLKGAGSIIATPDGHWFVNPTGNPGMSSAGMGDALAGIIAALIAQHVPAEKALLLGVYLHGAAADRLVAQGCGPLGLTASEVIDMARQRLNNWIYPKGE